MTSRDPELDKLTSLLGRCLGRIDEQAYRLLGMDDDDDAGAADMLENEASTLQELVDTMLVVADCTEETDVNRAVERVTVTCLQEVGMPIVLRQNLASNLPTVACSTALITYALQRAMVLAVSTLDAGGEIGVTTRLDDGSVVVELESRVQDFDEQLQARAETLCDFVDGFGGRCRLDCDQHDNLLIVLELPQVLATGEH